MPSPQATTSLSPAAATAPTAAPGPKGLRMVHGGPGCAKTVPRSDRPGISRERKGRYAELPNRERDGGTAAAVPRPGGSRRAARRGPDRARQAPRDRPRHPPGRGGGGRSGRGPARRPPGRGRAPQGRRPLELAGRTAVLVDDGVATGWTCAAAASYTRRAGAARVVVAVPVGPPGLADRLAPVVDQVVVLLTPDLYLNVGQAYERFAQVDDDEVLRCLEEGRQGVRG